MVKTKDRRASILALHQAGITPADIAKRLLIPRTTVFNNLKRFKETGTMDDRPRSGRPKTATSNRIVKVIREKIRRDPRRSMRKMAADAGISEKSVRRICKTRLNLRPYKIQKAHVLTESMKKIRLQRCKALLKRFTAARHSVVVFTDECLFNIEQFVNHQNDRILVGNMQDANDSGRIASRSGHPQSVMAFGGITSDGKTPLIFVDQGVKVNSRNYLNDILKKELLPWALSHFGNRQWTFQQDSAPAHKAKIVQDWCAANFPDFISAKEWPPYSPDLNPMDYSVWSVLKAKACATPHRNLDSLRRALEKTWDDLDLSYLRAAVDAFPKRLRACIKANGGLFEI